MAGNSAPAADWTDGKGHNTPARISGWSAALGGAPAMAPFATPLFAVAGAVATPSPCSCPTRCDTGRLSRAAWQETSRGRERGVSLIGIRVTVIGRAAFQAMGDPAMRVQLPSDPAGGGDPVVYLRAGAVLDSIGLVLHAAGQDLVGPCHDVDVRVGAGSVTSPNAAVTVSCTSWS
ncbi:hypothetical protein GCM10010289_70320 [Streptomyces violascens]|nr:hypothetical protein GCM10010289_70320 [Streptomyces violascens]